MPTIAPVRSVSLVEKWLDLDTTDSPAGPLFSGRFTEFEIVMTGNPSVCSSATNTGCGMCSGSYCRTVPVECW